MFFSCAHYSTGFFGLQEGILLNKYEGDRKQIYRIVQNTQVFATENIGGRGCA